MKQYEWGLTLAEVLITLAVLAVIATFVVPKILSVSSESEWNHRARQGAMEFNAAYQQYLMDENATSATTVGDLSQYINYTSVDGATSVDLQQTGTQACSAADWTCLKLSNGAMLYYRNTYTFAGTDTTNAIWVNIDADGEASDVKAVGFFMYFDGRLKTRGTIDAGTVTGGDADSPRNPIPAKDPTWFSWN